MKDDVLDVLGENYKYDERLSLLELLEIDIEGGGKIVFFYT